jgi:hypothetical protein
MRDESQLDRIESELQELKKMATANFAALQAQAAQNESVENSALVVIQGIAAQVSAAVAAAADGDDAALPALVTALNASATPLAAAVAANTIAAPSSSAAAQALTSK